MPILAKLLAYFAMTAILLSPATSFAAVERTLWESGGGGGSGVNEMFWGGYQDEFVNASGFGQINANPTIAIAKIINVALGFMGVIATCIIILTGFKWMLSGGNEDKIKECKQTLVGTVVGSIIILMSFSAAQFVLDTILDASFA